MNQSFDNTKQEQIYKIPILTVILLKMKADRKKKNLSTFNFKLNSDLLTTLLLLLSEFLSKLSLTSQNLTIMGSLRKIGYMYMICLLLTSRASC